MSTHMLHHSVLQILPPLLSLLWIGKDIGGRAVRWAISQFLSIIIDQWGPAHQLHCGELFQKIPAYENMKIIPMSHKTNRSDGLNVLRIVALVFGDFFKFFVFTDSVHKVRLLIVVRGKDNVQHHTLQGLKNNGEETYTWKSYFHEKHLKRKQLATYNCLMTYFHMSYIKWLCFVGVH